ncbi:hypothetical protein [Sulfurivirga sp.]|uniref:hypothetical protein n=1 Tax=Sulfurivirga sp. TaxID=2614236 RepID=UPI0025D723D7|nr:hypothetical protein [Sulfurivirga sp.]
MSRNNRRNPAPSPTGTERSPRVLPWRIWKEQSHLVRLNLRLAHLKKQMRDEHPDVRDGDLRRDGKDDD